ncbi:hypothetical protein RSK60_170002 [Ralstonia solanacearum K60]|nr:hypothetical protein RSK60_170002 [Ralstonia solanacearum K60]
MNLPSSIDSHCVGCPFFSDGIYALKWLERRVTTLRTGMLISQHAAAVPHTAAAMSCKS